MVFLSLKSFMNWLASRLNVCLMKIHLSLLVFFTWISRPLKCLYFNRQFPHKFCSGLLIWTSLLVSARHIRGKTVGQIRRHGVEAYAFGVFQNVNKLFYENPFLWFKWNKKIMSSKKVRISTKEVCEWCIGLKRGRILDFVNKKIRS